MKCWRWSRCTRAIRRPSEHRARSLVRVPAPAATRFSPRLRGAGGGHHAANARIVFRDAQQSERRDLERAGSERDRRAGAPALVVDRGGRSVCGAGAGRPRSQSRGAPARSSGDRQQLVEVAFDAGIGAPAGWWDRRIWRSMRNLSPCACCSACRVSSRRRRSPHCRGSDARGSADSRTLCFAGAIC